MAHTQEARAKLKSEDKGMGEVVGELWQLTKDYAKQETVDPLKALGRFVALGVPGSVLLGLGSTLLALGLLRLLQNETGDVFDGNWSFVPYLIVLLLALAVAGAAAMAITKTRDKEPDA